MCFRAPALAISYVKGVKVPISKELLTLPNASKLCVQIAGAEVIKRNYEVKFIPYSILNEGQRLKFIEYYKCSHLLLRRGNINLPYRSKEKIVSTFLHGKKYNWFLFKM